jgi:pyrroloquinoline quinone biosynthesis protein D
MSDEAKPKLAPGVRLHQDAKRGPVLMAPERVLELDETALSIVSQFDGKKRLSEIAALLAKEYDAKASDILADIEQLLKELTAKGYVKS